MHADTLQKGPTPPEATGSEAKSNGQVEQQPSSNADLKLSRKRARDRKAQAAFRNRSRNLHAQVADLSKQLREARDDASRLRQAHRNTEESHQSPATIHSDGGSTTQDASQTTTESRSSSLRLPPLCPGEIQINASGFDINFEPRLLAAWHDSAYGSVVSSPSTCSSGLSWVARRPGLVPVPSACYGISEPGRLPWNLPPSSPADRIIHEMMETHRNALKDTQTDPARPTPLAQDSKFQAIIERSTSQVAGDLIRTYQEIDKVPKQIACCYVISRLLNWLILQTSDAFEQLPTWLRPGPAQLTIPHPAWMDRLPWPSVRNHIIRNQEGMSAEWAGRFATSFDVLWPYEDRLVILAADCHCNAGRHHRINPVFEQHVRNLRNYRLLPQKEKLYPEFAAHVDADLLEYAHEAP